MLNIRLARTGRKRDAHFRVVVSDSVHGRVGRIVETLGYYHPRMPNDAEGRLHIETDRARYWLGHGAQPSLTVKSFLKTLLAEPTPSEETTAPAEAKTAPSEAETAPSEEITAPAEAEAAPSEAETGASGTSAGSE